MQDYQEYMNTLASVINDRNEEIDKAQREYAAKLPGVEETKSIIETATGLPSSIFLEKGLGNFLLKKEGRSYLTKQAKNIFDKGRDFYNDNLSKNTQERAETGGTKAEEPTEQTFENPTFDENQVVEPVEAEPFEEGKPIDLDAGEEGGEALGETRIYSLKEIAEDPQLYKSYIKQTQPSYEGGDDLIEQSRVADLENINNGFEDGSRNVIFNPNESGTAEVSSESAVRDQLAPMRDLMNKQPQGQENGSVRPEQSSGTGDAEAGQETPPADSVGTSEDLSKTLSETADASQDASSGAAAGEGAGAVAGEGAGEGVGEGITEGIGAALDFDPFTALIGLFVGIAGLVGGIEGADSVKNPPTPKIPTQEQVSVQYGAGGF